MFSDLTMDIRTLCLAGILLFPIVASAQTADEIVTKVLAARGGACQDQGRSFAAHLWND